jgi:hypothetical protein
VGGVSGTAKAWAESYRVVRGEVPLDVSSVPALRAPGGSCAAVREGTAPLPILVVRTADVGYLASKTAATGSGAQLEYAPEAKQLHCSGCSGASRFDLSSWTDPLTRFVPVEFASRSDIRAHLNVRSANRADDLVEQGARALRGGQAAAGELASPVPQTGCVRRACEPLREDGEALPTVSSCGGCTRGASTASAGASCALGVSHEPTRLFGRCPVRPHGSRAERSST